MPAASVEQQQSAALMPHFLLTSGPQAGDCIRLDFDRLAEKPLVLGRRPDEADVALQSFGQRVSRRHAIVAYRTDDQLLTLADAGSSNGTQLNGEYIAGTVPLFPGDTITCGDVDLVFVVPLAIGVPLARLPGQLERRYHEDSEPGVARLEVVHSRVPGLREGAVGRLTPGHPYLIGRYSSNDLPLLEEGQEARLVSRRQAEIRWAGEGYIVRDLGAANPTWHNHHQLESAARLEDGDSLQIGSTLLRYRAPRLPLPGGQPAGQNPKAARPAWLRLLADAGPTSHRVLLPFDRQALVGRGEDNDLRLNHRSVSRRHARLCYEARRFMVADLGSANGTLLNGQPSGNLAVLQPGDRLKLGDFEFVFEEAGPEDAPPEDALRLDQPVTLELPAPAAAGAPHPVEKTPSGLPASDEQAPAVETVAAISHPLREIAPFDELDAASFNRLAALFKTAQYRPGQELAREGQGRGAFFVILEGRVSLSRELEGQLNNRSRLVVGELEAGSVYGEQALLADRPFANRLEAVEATRVLRLEENVFKRELAGDLHLRNFFEQQVAAVSATTWMRSTLLMRTLSQRTRLELAKRLRLRSYSAGQTLVEAGQPAEEFFLMVGGAATAYITDARGREVFLATLEEGDTFGDGIAVAGETYPMTVRAEREAKCYALTRADFESVLARSGDPLAGLGAGLGGLPLGAMLNRVGPFMTMPPQLVAKIAAEMKPKFFKKGEIIVSQDEQASAFYIVRSGRVEVRFRTSEGEERADMRLGPGQFFGEAALLTNTARADTVVAVEDCELLALYRNRLEAVLQLGAGYDLGQRFAKGLNKRFRPRRVADVSVTEHTSASGEHYYLLSRANGEQFFKLSERSRLLWDMMNGDNSLNDLSIAYFLEYKKLDLEGVANLVGQLQAAGFLQVPAVDERLVGGRPRRVNPLARALNWRVEFKNVDRLFSRIYEWGGQVFFWRPVAIVLQFIMLAGLGAFIYFGFFDAQASRTGILQIFQGGGAGAFLIPGSLPWWALGLALLLNFVIHELAHGLACKAYGRRVIGAGFGLQWGGPVFFVNTNEIWLERRGPRMVVNLAGPASNALFAGACSLLMFATSSPDMRTALFQMAAVAYTLVYLNINPLMELDGYFALMDWVEIPGLRRKALSYTRRRLAGQPAGREVGPRERRIYWGFTLLIPVYLLFTVVQFLFFLGSVLGSLGLALPEPWGWLLTLGLVGALVWPLVKELWSVGRDEEELEAAAARRRRRRRAR